MTQFAQWLDTAFAEFDYAILEFFHTLALVADPILNPLSRFLAISGDGAMACFILAGILLLFANTRKSGFCIAASIGISSLITNLTVKPMVARLRPYDSGIIDYEKWWSYVGEHTHSSYSFPSGHTTSIMAGMFALCLCLCIFNGKNNKKYRWVSIPATLYVIFIGASRNYIMVHYPSDIIGGILAGATGALIGFLIINFLYKMLEWNKETKFCAFMLNFDIKDLFKKK